MPKQRERESTLFVTLIGNELTYLRTIRTQYGDLATKGANFKPWRPSNHDNEVQEEEDSKESVQAIQTGDICLPLVVKALRKESSYL